MASRYGLLIRAGRGRHGCCNSSGDATRTQTLAVEEATIAGGASGLKPAAGMATLLRASGRSWRQSAMEAGRPEPKANSNVRASRSLWPAGQVEVGNRNLSVVRVER